MSTPPRPKQDDAPPSRGSKFPRLLYQLLEEPQEDPPALWWLPDGQSLAILPSAFDERIAPHYFQGTHFASIVRRLFRHGFDRLRLSSNDNLSVPPGAQVFRHDCFQKGRPELLSEIRVNHKRPYSKAILRHDKSRLCDNKAVATSRKKAKTSSSHDDSDDSSSALSSPTLPVNRSPAASTTTAPASPATGAGQRQQEQLLAMITQQQELVRQEKLRIQGEMQALQQAQTKAQIIKRLSLSTSMPTSSSTAVSPPWVLLLEQRQREQLVQWHLLQQQRAAILR